MQVDLKREQEVIYKKNDLNNWPHFLKARASKMKIRIDKDMYYYWLDVLPPVHQEADFFTQAEGIEYIIRFWKETRNNRKTHYYCQRTDVINLPL